MGKLRASRMATGLGHLLPGAGLISHSSTPGCPVSFRRVYGLYQMYKGSGNVLTSGRNLSVLLWVISKTSGERKPEEAQYFMLVQ